MAQVRKIYLTVDVDNTDYFSNSRVDELELFFNKLKNVLTIFPGIKSTWFLRIDDHTMEFFGKPDYVFEKHKDKIDWLLTNGHQIGWHHHAYKFENNKWIQELDNAQIQSAIKRNGEIALEYGLKICRMGWSYHTNETMKLVDEMGFIIDSSAVPRPLYSWELSKKNWNITPQHPYHPSLNDYRIEGNPHLKILEVPISTTKLSSSTDTEKDVMRYINPAYHSNKFEEAVENYKHQNLVLIFHPYELVSNPERTNSLLSFDSNVFESNLKYLINKEYEFNVLNDLLN